MASEDEPARRRRFEDEHLRREHAARAALVPLDRGQLQALLAHVHAAVERDGCDHSLRASEAWARSHGVSVAALRSGLEEHGGYCDCEVVLNIDPDEVLEPVRPPRTAR